MINKRSMDLGALLDNSGGYGNETLHKCSDPLYQVWKQMHRMTPNMTHSTTRSKESHLCVTGVPQTSFSLALRPAIFELQAVSRQFAPNDPKLPEHYRIKAVSYMFYMYPQARNLTSAPSDTKWHWTPRAQTEGAGNCIISHMCYT